MNQLQDQKWTRFQIEAEIEHFGEARIVAEQNRLWERLNTLEQQYATLMRLTEGVPTGFCKTCTELWIQRAQAAISSVWG